MPDRFSPATSLAYLDAANREFVSSRRPKKSKPNLMSDPALGSGTVFRSDLAGEKRLKREEKQSSARKDLPIRNAKLGDKMWYGS